MSRNVDIEEALAKVRWDWLRERSIVHQTPWDQLGHWHRSEQRDRVRKTVAFGFEAGRAVVIRELEDEQRAFCANINCVLSARRALAA